MRHKFGLLLALVFGTVLTLLTPTVALAKHHNWEHERHEYLEYRRHLRHERLEHRRYLRRHYRGYYDRWGYWHWY